MDKEKYDGMIEFFKKKIIIKNQYSLKINKQKKVFTVVLIEMFYV